MAEVDEVDAVLAAALATSAADALTTTEDERTLLAFIPDEALRNDLLLKLLRAPADATVLVQVNHRMKESDSFCGASLSELLTKGNYLDASLRCESKEKALSYSLTCEEQPSLNRSYEGDDIIDHLLQYFAKELIRFPLVRALQVATVLSCISIPCAHWCN